MFNKHALALIVLLGCVAAISAMSAPWSPPDDVKQRLSEQFAQLLNGQYCDQCKTIAGQVKNSTPQQIQQTKPLFVFQCGLVGIGNPTTCQALIDSLFEQIVDKTPDEFCTEVGFCKST